MPRLRNAVLAIAAILLVLLGIDLYLLLSPAQVEARLRRSLASVFTTPFELREISFSVRSGIKIRGLVIFGPDGERTIAIDEAAVAVDWRRLALGEVTVSYPEIDLRRDAEGRLNLLRILDPALLSEDRAPGRLPTLSIAVDHARVRFRDAAGFLAKDQVVGLDDVDVDVKLSKDGAALRGSIADPLWKSAHFTAKLEPAVGKASVALDIRKCRLAPRADVRARIPPVFWSIWDALRMHGTGDLALRLTKVPGKPLDLNAEIKVLSGGVNAVPFPYPTQDVTGTIRILSVERGLHVVLEDLRGQQDGGRYRCDGDVWAMPKGEPDFVDLRFTIDDFPVDDRLGAALPPEVRPIWARLSPRGRADGRVRVGITVRPKGVKDDVRVSVDARAKDVAVRFADLPVPAVLSGPIQVRDRQVTIEDVRGTMAGGRVKVDGAASPDDIDLRISARNVVIDEAFVEYLRPNHRAIFDLVGARGRIDATVHVTGERGAEGTVTPSFLARIVPEVGLTLALRDFPYPLAYRSGEFELSPAGARFEGIRLGSIDPSSPLSVTVSGASSPDDERTGQPGAVDIVIAATRLPLDEALERAAAARAPDVFRALRPAGGEISSISLTATAGAGGPLAIEGEAHLAGAAIRPVAIGIPITDLRGTIRLRDDIFTLDRVEGRLCRAPVRASGCISADPAVTSTARIAVEDLELDEELRAALPPALQRAFALIRPQGRLRADLAVRGAGARLDPVADISLERGAFLLTFFPLAATGLRGTAHLSGGVLRLDRLKGKIGTGDFEARGYLALGDDGNGGGGSRGPRGSLRAEIRRLPRDLRLVDALPEASRAGIADLAPAGMLAADLAVFYDPAAAGGDGVISYVGELSIEKGKLEVGVDLADLEASAMLHGSFSPGTRGAAPRVEGGIFVRRALVFGQALERLTGRLRLDPELFELSELRGEWLGGIATGGFYSFSDRPRAFGAEISLAGGRLERWRSRSTGGKRRLGGLIEGELVLAGRAEEPGRPKRLRGEGEIRVRDGALFELPLFAGILNALSLELPGKPVFDYALAEARLDGSRIAIDRAELSSAALSFLGKGTLEKGEFDIRLTHELGRNWFNRVPVFGPFWRFLKGNLVEVEVRGPLESPRVTVIPLKVLTDPARNMLEERRERGNGK